MIILFLLMSFSLNKLKQHLSDNLPDFPNFFRVSLLAMNKYKGENLDGDKNLLLSLNYSNQRYLKLKEQHLVIFVKFPA